MSDQGFDEWVISNSDVISSSRAISVSPIPTEPADISTQLSLVRQSFVSMGDILQDATSWVLKSHAVATQLSREKWPDYTAEERRSMSKSDPTYLRALKIKGDVEITIYALKSLHFEILNGRRSTFHPSAHVG